MSLRSLSRNLSLGQTLYVIIYMILTLCYCSPRILAEYANIDVSHINENFEFPLEIFSWGLLIICSVCSGLDLGISKKFKFEKRQTELKNVFLVVVLLSVTMLESALLSYFLGHDFVVITDYGKQVFKGISLPLEGIATAIVSACTFLFSGAMVTEEKNEKTSNDGNSCKCNDAGRS